MTSENPSVPYGYCHCGCGQKTNLAPCTAASKGWVKGEPKKFVLGHSTLKHHITDEERREHRAAWEAAGIPYGSCLCGCGEKTKISRTMRDGGVRGEPFRYIVNHAPRDRKPDRFRVEDCGYETPCWVWQLFRDGDGYGKEWDNGRQRPAHRVAWERLHGPVPPELHIDHLCRNTSCVNPDHLEPVTPTENRRRGARIRLSPAKVREIRRRYAAGEFQRELAEAFDVSLGTIQAAVTDKTWRDI